MVQAEVADTGVLVPKMVEELFCITIPPIKCHTDSQSLFDHLATSHVVTDSRICVDIARIKEMVDIAEIVVQWIPKEKQLADSLTKAGASTRRLLDVLRKGYIQ